MRVSLGLLFLFSGLVFGQADHLVFSEVVLTPSDGEYVQITNPTANDIDMSEDIVATCGSGVSACVISVALHCLGKENIPIYDGSWTEWATSGQKIQTGN